MNSKDAKWRHREYNIVNISVKSHILFHVLLMKLVHPLTILLKRTNKYVVKLSFSYIMSSFSLFKRLFVKRIRCTHNEQSNQQVT